MRTSAEDGIVYTQEPSAVPAGNPPQQTTEDSGLSDESSARDLEQYEPKLTLQQLLNFDRMNLVLKQTDAGTEFQFTLSGVFGLEPANFRCAINLSIPRNPVLVGNNFFEREDLLRWVRRKHQNPLNRQPLSEDDIKFNPFASILLQKVLVESPETLFEDDYDEADVANAYEYALQAVGCGVEDSREKRALETQITLRYVRISPSVLSSTAAVEWLLDLWCASSHNFAIIFEELFQPTLAEDAAYSADVFFPLFNRLVKDHGEEALNFVLEKAVSETARLELVCVGLMSTRNGRRFNKQLFLKLFEQLPENLAVIKDGLRGQLEEYMVMIVLVALISKAYQAVDIILQKYPFLLNTLVGGNSILTHLINVHRSQNNNMLAMIKKLFEYPQLNAITYDDYEAYRSWRNEHQLRRRVKERHPEIHFTPLQLACYYQHPDVVALLVKLSLEKNVDVGVNMPSQGDYKDRPALLISLRRNDFHSFGVLLDHPQINPDIKDSDGNTALVCTVAARRFNWVQRLITAKANPFICGGLENGASPLVLAFMLEREHALQLLQMLKDSYANHPDELIDALCANSQDFNQAANQQINILQELLPLRDVVWQRFQERINLVTQKFGYSPQTQEWLRPYHHVITDPTCLFHQYIFQGRRARNGQNARANHSLTANFTKRGKAEQFFREADKVVSELASWVNNEITQDVIVVSSNGQIPSQ